MVSFFRRKKPEKPDSSPSERRYSTEELAAAFPQADESDAPDRAADGKTAAAIETEGNPPAIVEEPIPVEIVAAALEAEADTADIVAPSPSASAPAAVEPVQSKMPVPEPIEFDPIPVEPLASPAPASPASVDKPSPPASAPTNKTGWRERLAGSLFARSFGGVFSRNPKLDDDLLDEIETALITADVGVAATTDLVEVLRRRMKAREFADARALLDALRHDLLALLEPVAVPLVIDPAAKPFVLLTVGVNGVGKTTTIGKLAKRFKDENRSLMLAAGDTFRAAAVAQLQAWGERNGVPVVAQGQNADAASVAFDALQAAKARGIEVLIADTAGRLHTQQGLMAELGKIKRVIQKLDPAAPHEVLMVIDGTTGQNALSQLRQFHAAVGVTGLVVTKLDGTAKGGVVFALAREFGIPIRFAGIGERPEDLRVFDAGAFVDALLPPSLGA
ncbi:signal recognition particle-docking protein FtsY [Lysobacter sp. F60174L2]|uniref:signal recognition particle-docking protein FtsY n=1 Tax=Lysobacter sp. F60174L2 TaxID=3459295 RepID=UPI00403E1A51